MGTLAGTTLHSEVLMGMQISLRATILTIVRKTLMSKNIFLLSLSFGSGNRGRNNPKVLMSSQIHATQAANRYVERRNDALQVKSKKSSPKCWKFVSRRICPSATEASVQN